MRRSTWIALVIFCVCCGATAAPLASSADDGSLTDPFSVAYRTQRLHMLAPELLRLAAATPGLVAITVEDLKTGRSIAVNGGRNLPAASTIKIPVMVQVFRDIDDGAFTLARTVSLTDDDRDCGFGDLCEAPDGSAYSVEQLLVASIDDSDNTAANMLIRLVGRTSINETMRELGLNQTRLGDSIRSDGDIRVLRTSADDMLHLLTGIADGQVVSPGASRAMFRLLAQQRHNSLLPASLPTGLVVAHKTGTLHDTLNDVGIVELHGTPYVICAFSTHLADLDDGERFIRRASRLAFEALDTPLDGLANSNARL